MSWVRFFVFLNQRSATNLSLNAFELCVVIEKRIDVSEKCRDLIGKGHYVIEKSLQVSEKTIYVIEKRSLVSQGLFTQRNNLHNKRSATN